MTRIKLGIIGCGIAARNLHWPALKRMPDKFEITAVCNHTPEKARTFSELVGGVPYMQDYRELLERDDVEAVDIILPIELNLKVTRDALQAGKHVLVEKPLAANLNEAAEMMDLDRRYNKVKMVAENFRYRPGLLRAGEHITEGLIGKIHSVFWNYFSLMTPDNKYAQTNWRINHKYPGGFITDGGVHNIAGIRLLFGDITGGHTFVHGLNPAIGDTDTFCLQFVTDRDITGVLNLFISTRGYAENRILVLGDQGSLIIENELILITDQKREILREKVADDNGFYEEFTNFYRAITKGTPVVSTFREGYRDLATILTALEIKGKWQTFSYQY